jgi:F420-0:gamma-glutamyl ligase
MEFITVKTRPFLPPKDNLWELLDAYVKNLQENDILLITSKILAIHQGRCVKINPSVNKEELIMAEAEAFIKTSHIPNHDFILTIKGHTMLPSSGIDESNADDHYILWPKDIQPLLKEIHTYLTKKFNINNLGIITTDSHCTPMRHGVLGISIGFYGMEPLYDYRGKNDIFNRELKFTQTNIVDALSAMAVMLMGEGNECTPMVIAREVPSIKFTDSDKSNDLVIEPEQDLYYPLLKNFQKTKE